MRDGRRVVLVTGSTGFIGRHLAHHLTADGWIIRPAVRKQCGITDEVVIGSLGPHTDWQAALADVDAVIHLAARVHHKNDELAVELYRDVNIQGTLHLAQAAKQAGVRQFIFVSTVLVHGRSNDGRAPFSETDPLTPRGLYGASKAAAEAGLRLLAQDSDMQITVIRPPLVYGSGGKGNFAPLLRAVKLGIPLPFAAIENCRAFLSVHNLASFISWRLSRPGANFDLFLIADSEQVSTPEFVARLANAAGLRSRLFSMPTSVLGALLRATGNQDAYDGLIGSLKLDTSKAAAAGWIPSVSMVEGLRRAVNAREL